MKHQEFIEEIKNELIQEGFDPKNEVIKGIFIGMNILQKKLNSEEIEKGLNLVTIKKANQLTGASTSFFKQLLREGKLKKYRINSAIYISLSEFEKIAQSV